MSETLVEVGGQAGDPAPIELDPFGFFEGVASRIEGVGGGNAPGHDPGYVFHTPYVPARRGRATFTIRIEGLKAKRGTLVLRVNMMSTEPGAHARLVNSERILLNRLVAQGGVTTIAFEGFRGVVYAVMGSIPDATDASADRLVVTLDHPDDGSDYAGAVAEARSTVFGSDALRPTARLVSPARSTLADPVSQMCTASQFDEPAYARWLERLRQPRHRHRKQWEFVYILQALERYGMLQPGARGLGFGVGREPLPAVMAAMGVSVVATDLSADDAGAAVWHETGQHGAALDSLRHPEICDDATFAERVSFRPADMNAIPEDLVNFDFAWSSCAYEHLGSIAAGLRFVERSLDCLRPGGVAVHTTELNLTSNDDTIDHAGTVLFRRRDMERLALMLISRGHEVAQIRFDGGSSPLDTHVDVPPYGGDPHLKMALGRYATTSFGIIARKARTPL